LDVAGQHYTSLRVADLLPAGDTRESTMNRSWANEAIRRIEADFARSADTHLQRVELPGCPGLVLYLKDESTHPTGSLKHRLARSLFLYGLCNGWIREGAPVVIDASSGSARPFRRPISRACWVSRSTR
jgi:hypothetical protein